MNLQGEVKGDFVIVSRGAASAGYLREELKRKIAFLVSVTEQYS